ncbi:MAG: hypothetical protein LUH19_00205 [Lachnospiraceae bacterium]|nr:hypothetical protein [Lachnospiraceae bacterium]
MREKRTKKRLLLVLIIAWILAAALLIWRLVSRSFQILLPDEEISETVSGEMTEEETEETAEQTAEQTMAEEEAAFSEENRYSGMLLSIEEYPELYEQAAVLLEERTDLLEQLLISDNSDLNNKITITVDGSVYFLLEKENFYAWSDYQELAAAIYADSYVENQFTHDYSGLYEEADGRLYRVMADGFVGEVDEDSIRIFSEVPSLGEYVITAAASTGTVTDGQVRLSFNVRANESKPYGLEIVEEICVEKSAAEKDWAEAYIEYIMENEAGPEYLGYQLIDMDDDSCPELIVSEPAEGGGFRILHYNDGTVSATQSNRLYYSYIPYGNLLLNAEGNMGLYTDDVYSIVDGQMTLIATGYRGLWKMNNGEIEWSGNNLEEDRYYWGGEELSEEEYAAALQALYPSEQAVECYDIPYYSYREIVALLDESYLQEIPAPKG